MKNRHIEYKHPSTVWEVIKHDVELDIINNTYRAGDKVPSINQLSNMYNVSNNTSVKVLESLCKDSTVLKKKGIGYFVMPYAKDKLYDKYIKEMESDIKRLIKYSTKVISKEQLKVLFEDICSINL